MKGDEFSFSFDLYFDYMMNRMLFTKQHNLFFSPKCPLLAIAIPYEKGQEKLRLCTILVDQIPVKRTR